MALSKYTLIGDGVTTEFVVDFTLGYISKDDVTVQVNDEIDGSGDPIYRTLTWIDDALVNVGTAPEVDAPIVFIRTVSEEVLVHNFEDGAGITEKNLDEAHLQSLMLMHQLLDGRLSDTVEGDFNMGNLFTVTNLRDPVEDGDATPKSYVDAQQALTAVAASDAIIAAGTAVDKAIEAADSADAAEAFALAASDNVTDRVNSLISHGTDAPTGGTDGDIYFQIVT